MSAAHPPHAGWFLLHAPPDPGMSSGPPPRRVEVHEQDADPCDECGGAEGSANEPRCSACGGSGSYAFLWWTDPWTGSVFGTAPRMPALGDCWRWEALDEAAQPDCSCGCPADEHEYNAFNGFRPCGECGCPDYEVRRG